MKRRSFLKYAPISATTYALAHSSCKLEQGQSNEQKTDEAKKKTHVVSLSFDDGFAKSFKRVAEIHENYGTKGCFNVIATAHLPSFQAVGEWILPELMGDFNLWNDLVSRGHEVMPHTFEHVNLTKVSVNEAKERLDKCFDYFAENLDGYSHDKAVYNYAYNASTEELDTYCLQKVKAIRTGHWLLTGDTITNEFPQANYTKPIRLGCFGHGPDNGDKVLDKEIKKFLATDGGWMIVNLHGLDNEGWGPVSTEFYDGLIKQLVGLDNVDLLPVGQVLEKYDV